MTRKHPNATSRSTRRDDASSWAIRFPECDKRPRYRELSRRYDKGVWNKRLFAILARSLLMISKAFVSYFLMLMPNPLSPNETPTLYELSACFAELTKLLLRYSLHERCVKFFDPKDINKLQYSITERASSICSLKISRIQHIKKTNVIHVLPAGKFALDLTEANAGERPYWSIEINSGIRLVRLSETIELNVLAPLACVENIRIDSESILQKVLAIAELKYISAASRATDIGLRIV